MRSESGDQLRSEMPARWEERVVSWRPVRVCQILRVLSAAAPASGQWGRDKRASGEAPNHRPSPGGGKRGSMGKGKGGGGVQAEAMYLPHGENLTAEMGPVWPRRVKRRE